MLREYQIQAIKQIEEADNKNILLCMPTGSGKTFTFTEIAKRFFTENLKRVLIIVHRVELLNQAYNSLGERCFRIENGIKNIPSNYDYYVGMVETINRRLDKMPIFGLVIIDEAHFANFKKMPYFTETDCKVLGVTATPISKKPLSLYYNKLINPTNINRLINEGFLLDCDVWGFASDLVSKANFKTKMGEYDEKQMQDFYSSEKMVKNVIEAYWSKAIGKKTIIFNVNVMHNLAVYEALKNEGLNVYCIDGDTPKKEREEIIKSFKNEIDAIVCNVGVLTTGFDEPSIEVVILNRATKSLSLYLQMVGRGSRISENKTKFTVIDLGKNTTRHGRYDDHRDWEKYFKEGTEKDKNGIGASPIKECPECGFMQHTRVLVCEGCGHDFQEERERQIKEEKEQKLYLLIKERPIDIPIGRLFDLAEERGWKPYAVIYRIVDHIVKYKERHGSIVTDDYMNSLALNYLSIWCRKYDKKNNEWHKNYIIECLQKALSSSQL
jgi:superfamily II DNA or RNA helicase